MVRLTIMVLVLVPLVLVPPRRQEGLQDLVLGRCQVGFHFHTDKCFKKKWETK